MAIVNITAENDADFYRAFSYQTVSGVPIDISGGSMEMMLRWNAEDETAVIRLASDTGEFVLTDPVNGIFTLLISQPVLQRLSLGTYDHSNILSIGVSKIKIWSGVITINAGPTR